MNHNGCVVEAKIVFYAIHRYLLLWDPCSCPDMLLKLRGLSPGPRLAILDADWLSPGHQFVIPDLKLDPRGPS
jgi:hypothetical protein